MSTKDLFIPTRHLPVRPNLDQLKNQAKDLLKSFRRRDTSAIAEFVVFHPGGKQWLDSNESEVKLADAQIVLARSYGVASWPRLVQACQVIEAIWHDQSEELKNLMTKNPSLLHENARATTKCNWGPPMSYAANLGRDEIIKMLYGLGARDLEHAIDRATLQSRIPTARMLHEWLGSPKPAEASLSGPAYTLSVVGTALMLELGAPVIDQSGKRLAPVDVVLESDSRKPSAKHEILELYVHYGLELPDTPTMAVHRGRVDLLERHLKRDRKLLERTFSHEEVYPPEMGCHDEISATQGTPLKGSTLLHLCTDYDELEIARWLLDQGMDPNVRADVDADGFGGHTALFGSVVSQPAYWINHQQLKQNAALTQLLLDRGADPNMRASIRKQLHPGYGPRFDVSKAYEYRNVTALSWGQQFHAREFVNELALKLIEAAGGKE
jgi:hypothetical protein